MASGAQSSDNQVKEVMRSGLKAATSQIDQLNNKLRSMKSRPSAMPATVRPGSGGLVGLGGGGGGSGADSGGASLEEIEQLQVLTLCSSSVFALLN